MSQLNRLELMGCTPEPLIAYLKAVGIFRLVAKQKDKDARTWWQADTFFLRSTLDRDALVEFFLHKYRPTPIASPWNNRYRTGVVKGDKSGLDAIQSAYGERFSDYRETITQSRQLLEQETDKDRILARCRNTFPDSALEWIDATYALTNGRPAYPPLTSNGGTLRTSSSGDISMNFAKNLVEALGIGRRRRGSPANTSHDMLLSSMFNDVSPPLPRNSGGQFQPGGWGPNASAGFEGDSLLNPWDFVFMVEGVLMFAGALARRLSPESRSKAVFPFTVDTSAAGYSTPISSEYGTASRAEFWVPLWDRPATFEELLHIASEGRAQLGRRQVSNGVGFVRAIAGLGTERGVGSFQRFGFLQRTGLDGVFAVPIGRFATKPEPKANVLFDLDHWLERLRSVATGRNAPTGLGAALRQVNQAIIEFCQRGQPRDLQNVLIAVGHAERWLATSSVRKAEYPVLPLNSLSREWLDHADDQTIEFRLAISLASILPGQKDDQTRVGPIRENLEQVESRQRTEWKEGSTSFVWTSGNTLSNLLAVLGRRCVEARMHNLDHFPLASTYPARLDDIAAFLNGGVDVQRIADLALPMSFVRYGRRLETERCFEQRSPFDLPAAYAAMKLTLLPDKFTCPEFGGDKDVRMEPQMLTMLRAGRVRNAYQVAYRRLMASGLRPLSTAPGIADGSGQGDRLSAALLFPLDRGAHKALSERGLMRALANAEAELQAAEQSSDSLQAND